METGLRIRVISVRVRVVSIYHSSILVTGPLVTPSITSGVRREAHLLPRDPHNTVSVEILSSAFCSMNNANRSLVSPKSTFCISHFLFSYLLSFVHALRQEAGLLHSEHVMFCIAQDLCVILMAHLKAHSH